MAIYLCSDIHGQYQLFQRMLEAIHFSEEDHLFVLGDVIDRGPRNIPMLLDIAERPNVTCLLGNHEWMMYRYYRAPEERSSWLYGGNGGARTKAEFERLGKEQREAVLGTLGEWYLQVEITENGRTFLLSHSDFLENEGTVQWKNVDANTVSDIVWNSPWRFWEYVPLEKYARDGRMHVIGHVPVEAAVKEPQEGSLTALVDEEHHVIDIDLGCARMARSMEDGVERALCCMNLTEYARGNPDAFVYIR